MPVRDRCGQEKTIGDAVTGEAGAFFPVQEVTGTAAAPRERVVSLDSNFGHS